MCTLKYLPRQILAYTKNFFISRKFTEGSFQIHLRAASTTNFSKDFDSFKKEIQNYEKKSIIGIDYVKKKIYHELKTSECKFSLDELKELISLSRTDEDIELIANVLSKNLQKNENIKNPKDFFKLVNYFIKLIILLQKPEKLIEILNKKKLEALFQNKASLALSFEYLYEKKYFEDIIHLFNNRLHTFKVKLDDNNNNNSTTKSKVQMIISPPFEIFEIFTKTLISQNTPKSFNLYREVINYIYKNGGNVNQFFILRLLYLAILQNDCKFGLEVYNTGAFENNLMLKKNLQIILYAKSKQPNKVIDHLIDMLRSKISIYQFTFDCLRTHAKELNSLEYQNEIDEFFKLAIVNDLISANDLTDIVFTYSKKRPNHSELSGESN